MAAPRIPLARAPRTVAREESEFPAGIADLADAPSALRVAGTIPPLTRAIAIVGTRFADPEAMAFARGLAFDLARLGAVIVSGGALGIDRAAHDGALSAGKPTIAVLATGLDRAYPPSHAEVFAAIAERGGALVTEVPDGTPPRAARFIERNRLIAALSTTVVVVQAPVRSGALSTAAWARKLGRPLFAVPGAPWTLRSEGCLGLLRRGAQVCTSAADVLSVRPALGPPGDRNVPRGRDNSPDIEMLDEDGQIVFAALEARGRHPDELAAALKMPASRLQGALLGLELAGFVAEAGGLFRRVRG